MTTRLAACSCGQLTAQVKGEPLRVSVCHCLACQRRSGSAFAEQARFARDDVTIVGQSTEFTLTGDAGSSAVFHFCPRCGATVYYRTVGVDDQVAIPVGAFADPQFPPPQVSVYESRMRCWMVAPVGAEHIP